MSSQWYYRPGDYYQLDDLSGFKIRASRSRKIPGGQTGGLIVAPERWEPQHPQDFVRGVVDDQTVPQARPRQQNRFVITATYVMAFSPRHTGWITVDSVDGFSIGDRISVMLDSGENYYPTIIQLLGNQMRITPLLPHSVGGPYADPIENVVIDMGPSGQLFLTNDAGVPITDEEGNLFETTA